MIFKLCFALYTTNPSLASWGNATKLIQSHAQDHAMQPTVKPVRLVADAILECSRRGDAVLNGFSGARTTLLAAERTGRIGYDLEIQPRYVDTTIRRLEEHAGLVAIQVETGRTFSKVEAECRDENSGPSGEEVEP